MSIVEAFFLGIVQGLTEFLPVSSSGHLVLAKSILGIHEEGIAFEIFVHFGTLLAVITVFRRDLTIIVRDCFKYLTGKLPASELAENESIPADGVRLFAFIIIGTVPTAIIGFLFKDFFESAFSDAMFVSGALMFTGVLLSLTKLARNRQLPLTGSKSFLMGLAQVVALFPGVSRSGVTITSGLLLGVKAEEAAKFSFLLAVPLILGVTLLQSLEMIAEPPSGSQLVQFAIGCASAYFSGLWAIKWLLAVVQHGRFARFAYYCFAVGIIGIIVQLQ